jgi:hypothetical protein
MGGRLVLTLMLACGCKTTLENATVDASGGGDARRDGGQQLDAPADAIVLGAWGIPTPVSGASDAVLQEDDVTLNSAMTELYFSIPNPNPGGNKDLYLMTRATPQAPWSTPQPLALFNTTASEESPRLSPNDLTIYFGRGGDIYTATRTSVGSAWSTPTMVPGISTALNYEKWLAVCNNGYFMVSRANGVNGQDLYQGQIGVDNGSLITELSSTSNEISSFLSNDCLTAYFASNRSGTTQLYTATRTSVTSPWSTPTMFTALGTSTDNEDPWVAPDNRTFVFATVRGNATKDLYISTR